MGVIVRLKPGVSQQVAEQQLDQFFRARAAIVPREFPMEGFQARLVNYLASGRMQASLNMLFVAVALLLIACANVANLRLARAKIGVRLSIGAARRRILRQLLAESVLLPRSVAASHSLRYRTDESHRGPDAAFQCSKRGRITVNVFVLLFSFGVSVLSGILFGLAPAIHSTRQILTESLREGSR